MFDVYFNPTKVTHEVDGINLVHFIQLIRNCELIELHYKHSMAQYRADPYLREMGLEIVT